MDFSSSFDSMSPVAPIIKKGYGNKSHNKLSDNTRNYGKLNNKLNTAKHTNTHHSKKNPDTDLDTRLIQIVPIILLEIVFFIVMRNIWSIRNRCKCSMNRDMASLLLILYSTMSLIYGVAIVWVLQGHSIESIRTVIPSALALVFLLTLVLTYAYIYKVETACSCQETLYIYNILKMYTGIMVFLLIGSGFIYGISKAIE